MNCMFSHLAMLYRCHVADIMIGKQAVWGSSFGWEIAATWRAVWPTPYARIHSNTSPVSVHLGQQIDSSSQYPYFILCESRLYRGIEYHF